MAFCNAFLKGNGLVCKSVKQIEDQRVDALSKETVTKHIARVQGAFNTYNIKHPKYLCIMEKQDPVFKNGLPSFTKRRR